MKIVLSDTLKEIFRENISYIIFTLFLVGLSHTILISLNIKSIYNISVSKTGEGLFTLGVLSVFSYLYLGVILLSLFLNNSFKGKLGKKCELLFYGIDMRKIVFFRVIGFITGILVLSLVWYGILFVLNPFNFHIPNSIFWKSYFLTLLSLLFIIVVPVYFSFKLREVSTFFISFVFLVAGDLVMFYTPFIKTNITIFKNIVHFMPNWDFLALSYIVKILKYHGINISANLSLKQAIVTVVLIVFFIFSGIKESGNPEI